MGNNVTKVILEWQFTPKNFFEETIVIPYGQFDVTIADGKAEAHLEPEHFHASESLTEDLTHDIESRFLAVQVLTRKPFHLSKPSRSDLRQDGKRNVYVAVESIAMTLSVSPVDFIVKDKDGNITADSKKERLGKQKRLADTLAQYRGKDDALDHMLKSYSASIEDPLNELVHLYEIKETVKTKLGGEETVRKALNISNNEWKILGSLPNEPLVEGRHRGKHFGRLRNAEPHELESVRKVALKIIEEYLKFLTSTDHA